MKRIYAMVAVAAVAAMAMTGCEWSTHDDDVQSYNDTGWQWVNFSGTYQKYGSVPLLSGEDTQGGYIVKEYKYYWDATGEPICVTPTGAKIAAITVHQKGNRISLSDSAGGSYSGSVSDVRSVGGSKAVLDMAVGDVAVATFSCKGRSGAGNAVTITGTLQGRLGEEHSFENRTLSGTWLELGRGASIDGTASPFNSSAKESI